jgi:hypothetical protein
MKNFRILLLVAAMGLLFLACKYAETSSCLTSQVWGVSLLRSLLNITYYFLLRLNTCATIHQRRLMNLTVFSDLKSNRKPTICREDVVLSSIWTSNVAQSIKVKRKGKAVLVTDREGPYGCDTSTLSHFVQTIGSQMAVNLSALRAGRHLTPGRFLVLISLRGWVDPRAVVRLEELGKLKNPMTTTGIEHATFRLVA